VFGEKTAEPEYAPAWVSWLILAIAAGFLGLTVLAIVLALVL